jgi:tetratricopeptide (TPR) repeat protein
MKVLFKIIAISLAYLCVTVHLQAQSKSKGDSVNKIGPAKAQQSADQSLFLDYVKSIKEQNQKDIEGQNKRIDDYLKSEENQIDFHLSFLEVFLAVMSILTIYFAYNLKKEGKANIAELKAEIAEKKIDFNERYDSLKIRLGEAQAILKTIEETTLKAQKHEQEYKQTLELLQNYDAEKALTEVSRKFIDETIKKSKEELKNSGLEVLKNLYLAKAINTNSNNQHEETIRLITNYLDISEGDADVYHRRGRAYLFLDKLNEAFNDFEKSISLNPLMAASYVGRGNVYGHRKEYAKALIEFEKAFEIDPTSSIVIGNMGLVFEKLGDKKKAMEYYTKSIGIDPKNYGAYANRGTLYIELGQYSEALADYDILINSNQNSELYLYNRGFTHSKLGNRRKAIEDYTKAIELNGEYSDAFWNRSIEYNLIGETANAKSDQEMALQLDPEKYKK